MTAMNGFGREDAAYLIADTASYGMDGTIVGLGNKVAHSARLLPAIGHSGAPGLDCQANIECFVQSRVSQSEVFGQLADFLRDLESDAEDGRWAAGRISDRARKWGVPEDELPEQQPPGIRLTLAWWDAEMQRGRTAYMASVDDVAGSGQRAYELRRFQTLFTPTLPFDRWPGHTFSPLDDVEELAQLQRQTSDDRGICRVGGQFDLYRINGDGITSATFHTWPDVVGEPIRLEPA